MPSEPDLIGSITKAVKDAIQLGRALGRDELFIKLLEADSNLAHRVAAILGANDERDFFPIDHPSDIDWQTRIRRMEDDIKHSRQHPIDKTQKMRDDEIIASWKRKHSKYKRR